MAFVAFELSVTLIDSLVEPLAKLRAHDPALADQARRAASSIALNLAEGRRRAGRDRLHCWRIAAGSAEETRAALRVAHAWRYLDAGAAQAALGHLDRLLGILWRLTR